MLNRIRTITTEGRVHVLDLSFSQTVALISNLDKAGRDAFWAKQDITLPNGDRVYLVREGA
jgi:hypothetical protein